MPRAKSTFSGTLRKYVSEQEGIFKTDGRILFCNICNKNVNCEKKFQVVQHLATQNHKDLSARRAVKASQSLLTADSFANSSNVFFMDLCNAFVASDIPLWKLNNPQLRNFFKKHTQEIVPNESTLRKNYVDAIYLKDLASIQEILQNKFLWISIDETIDIQGRFVANVIVGILHHDEAISSQKFLLNIVELERTNHSTIARAFDDSVQLLGPNFDKTKILLFVTDAAPYMVKAAKAIEVFYPKLIHLTCLAHAMHRVAEQIRNLYKDVDYLISNGKKIFLKAPLRVECFKDMFPNIPLPPEPVITRWGTWLNAVKYYAEYFEEFETFLKGLDDTDSVAIERAKEIINTPALKQHLAFIYSNYCFISDTISQLEGKNSLIHQINIVDSAIEKIQTVTGQDSQNIKNKLNSVIRKNSGYNIIKKIATTYDLSYSYNDLADFSPNELASFKYAPITSVDVERSFSMYKSVFRQNRGTFIFENFKKHFFIYANKAFINSL